MRQGQRWMRAGLWTVLIGMAAAWTASAAVGAEKASEPSSPTLAEGQALLQAGEAEKAAEVLSAVVKAEPASAAAWTALGQARAGSGSDAEAVTALLKGASLADAPASRRRALYAASQAQARLGRSEEALWILTRLREGNAFDLTNADGVDELYVSDWQDGARGPATGRIYVYSGADGRRLLTLVGEAAGDGFGIGPADAGDVDGDGQDDLVIGAWRHASEAPGAGKVYVISGKTGAELRTITAAVPGETFGFDAQGLGDVDGDGVVDLLLTSAWSRVSGPRSGRVFLLSGASVP